jgi:hypothetical protein
MQFKMPETYFSYSAGSDAFVGQLQVPQLAPEDSLRW